MKEVIVGMSLILIISLVFSLLAIVIFYDNYIKDCLQLYCQLRCDNILEYEQCNHKYLIKLLKEKQIIKGEQE